MPKRALIVANGSIPDWGVIETEAAHAALFIACDGAANRIWRGSLFPDIVIGDLDSYKPLIPNGTPSFELIEDPDQETNDLEKALNLAKKRECDEVVVLGATGGRTDHALKNLSVLQAFTKKFHALVFKDMFGHYLVSDGFYSAPMQPGTVVSLFPMTGRVDSIFTEGLRYPLIWEPLQNGVRDGSSNEAVADAVSVRHTKGELLIFVGDGPLSEHG